MKIGQLMDDWAVTGSDFDEFADLITDIDASTTILSADSCELVLYAIDKMTSEAIELLQYDVDQTMARSQPGRTRLRMESLKSIKASDDFIDEVMRSGLLMKAHGEILFTSCGLTRDLGARALVSGAGLSSPTPERTAFLMHRYTVSPCNVNLVVRSNTDDGGKVRKVFAMPSARYKYIPQSTLLNIAEYFDCEMLGADTKKWFISNNISQIWLEFNKQAEDIAKTYKLPDTVIPGVLLETSDTGDCALKVIPVWRRGKGFSYARGREYKREHKGSFNIDDVLDSIKDKVFSEYTKLPQRLCELLAIDVTNPAVFLEFLLEEARLQSIIGKRRMSNLLEALQGELNPAIRYTAYDIVMRLMELPASFDEDKWIAEQLESAVYRLPFLDIEKIQKKSSTPLVLTA